jgi:PST family polysaccharide transporter
MSLVKTSLLNGIAVAVKIGVAIILNKIIAVNIGPAGYAVIGQFQSTIAVVTSLSGGLMAPGITKGTAEHFDNEARQFLLWQTAVKISVIAVLIMSVTILLASHWLAVNILHRLDMSSVFVGLLAVVNGKKEIGIYVAANICGSCLSLTIVGLLTYLWGLYGALMAIAVSPSILLLSTGVLIRRRMWFKLTAFWGKVDPTIFRELSGFGLMGLTSALSAPLAYFFIRNFLVESIGLSAAGYWQASWKISEIYLMLVTTSLSTYYLPRLAEIKTAEALKKEICKVYVFILPIAMSAALLMYLLRDYMIGSLFSENFGPMRDLFSWQLTGDVIKIGSWILSFVMLGRSMVKLFILTELVFSVSFYFMTLELVSRYGLVGVSMAYAFNYGIYWVAMIYLVKCEIQKMIPSSIE